jgi:multidrug efflux pump subunit AcrB
LKHSSGFLGRLFIFARFQVYFNSGNCGAVAIIGTFSLANIGFSINMLTLFAMILAIGIVVDDAIVVVEAVHAKLDEGAKSAKEASSAMSEISGTISITLVMSAVFIPVSFKRTSQGLLPTVCSNFGHCYFDFGR